MSTTEDPAALPVALPADRDWTLPWIGPFLKALSVLPDVASACRLARVSRSTAYEARDGRPAREGHPARKPVPGLAEAWKEALELAQDFVVRHAHTWITTGIPVRSSRTVTRVKKAADGTVLETTTETTESEAAERSATLMIFWLKAFHPERFRWSERAEVTGADGGPIRIESIDEIDRMIGELTAELNAVAADEPVPTE